MNAVTKVGSFVAVEGKNGKISATSEKIALILNSADQSGLTALARDGKGKVGTLAREAVLGHAFGLPQVRVAQELDGSQWGNVLALLVGEYGPAYLNRATMRGKAGCVAYMAHVVATLRVKVDSCETVKAQDRAIVALNSALADYDHVARLFQISENARMTAQSIVSEVAPEVAPDVAPEVAPKAKRKSRVNA